MKRLSSFIKRAEWLRLIFFFVFFALFGVVASFFYNMVGTLYFDFGAKIFFSFVFGLTLMVFINFFRKSFRIPSNRKLLHTVISALVVIHFIRWSLHVTWLRSFDWTVGGLHPLFDFLSFMDYLWFIVIEGRLPGMHLVPNMSRFNYAGWVLVFYDFELHLRGVLLSSVWAIELFIISSIAVLGVYLSKDVFLHNHCAWARFEKLPYPFLEFTEADIWKIESGELEAITERTFAEGDVFSQVALVFAGKTKTEYIAVFSAKLNKRGKAIYSRPKEAIPIGLKEVENIELSLKETHAAFFDKKADDAHNPGIELVKDIANKTKNADKSMKERRQPHGTYKLP